MCNERAVQILPLLAVTGIAVGVGNSCGCRHRDNRTGHLLNLVSSIFFPVYPGSPAGGPNHAHSSGTDWLSGCSNTLKLMGSRLSYSWEGGLYLFLQEEWCVYVKQSGIVKKNKIQRKGQLSASNTWAFENPIWKWILPFLTLFRLIFLLLLILPCFSYFFCSVLQWKFFLKFQSNN